MKETTQQALAPSNGEAFTCEYVPFGGEEKIRLSFALIRKWLAAKTARGAEPGDHDVMHFFMVCKARKLNPFDGDAFLLGYDGKDGPVFSTVVAHQALLKRADSHPEYDGMESGVIVATTEGEEELVGDFYPPGATLLGGWCRVHFKNRRHPVERSLKLSTFARDTAIWRKNPEGMIVKCAEADALRSSFPALVGGMYLLEEMDIVRTDSLSRGTSPNNRERADVGPSADAAEAMAAERMLSQAKMANGIFPPRYAQDRVAADAEAMLRGGGGSGEEVQPASEKEGPAS